MLQGLVKCAALFAWNTRDKNRGAESIFALSACIAYASRTVGTDRSVDTLNNTVWPLCARHLSASNRIRFIVWIYTAKDLLDQAGLGIEETAELMFFDMEASFDLSYTVL